MTYITLDDLNNTIRKNLYKIPHDIDFVVGIPRSGMIVASIISELINVKLIDIDSFCNGCQPTGGNRLSLLNKVVTNKVLVVDDTSYSGKSMIEAKEKLKDFNYNFIYLCAYLEGSSKEVDIYLQDVRQEAKEGVNGIVLYEWNLFHHYPFINQRMMFDMDGVLCVEPPDEHNEAEYEEYIKKAIPLYVPTVKIGAIVTYRLEKYRDITEQWLKDNGVIVTHLVMCKGESYKDRQMSSEMMKAMIYAYASAFVLFVESNDYQAQEIHRLSGKPVLSIETNKLYK